ncbi:MAG TPA: branched-chain amino acid ABC transporter permease, partial [Candidatus Methylomirabilis sp.]|nr:branched-chain amino acid ABC transporter permease [Candidatus Methylomirabilis sp.]
MDWSTNLQMLAAGLAMGSIYALVALGFVLIFNAVGVVNFAQGEFVMVPAFVAVWLMDVLKIPFPLTYLITVIFMGVFGIVFQRIAYYPLRNRTFLPVIIATIGVSIFLKNAAQMIFGAEPFLMHRPTPPDVLNLAGIFVDPQYIVIIVATLALLVFQYFFFERTTLGKKMQATAQDKEMARLLGIRVAKMIAITFAYSSILGAAAGILVGPIFYVTKEMGGMLGLKAFCSTIVGGFGNV